MATLTLDQAYEKSTRDVKVWCRFDQIDNLLPIPTDEEIKIALNIALDDINVMPPKTSFTLLGTVNSQDAWYTTLMYGACKNVLWTLLCDWTANGIDAQLDSLSLASKRPDYESLFNLFNDQFNNRLENIKKSYGSKSISSRNTGGRARKTVLKSPFHGSSFSGMYPTAQLNRP